MGRKDSDKYRKDLHQQAYDKLTAMQAFGESKKDAVANGTSEDKIFSYNTYKTYWKHIKYFTRWINENHPECTTLKSAKKYVNEWLQLRVDQVNKNGEHLSAWTIQTETAALCKLYQIKPDDPWRFQPPKRNRWEIKRSRGDTKRDQHFSEKNNDLLIKFCKGTGCRRNVAEKLEGRDLWSKKEMMDRASEMRKKLDAGTITDKERKHLATLQDALAVFPDHEYFIHHRQDKNGRYRFAPIIGPNKDEIIELMKDTRPDNKVWGKIHSAADIHGYRAVYADTMYRMYERKIEDIPYDKVHPGTGRRYQGGVYFCRNDKKKRALDREAMKKCSKALGHNRAEVVATNYLRG
jgi:hypothetical protein